MRSLGRSGRAQGFAAFVSALVFTFVAFVYDAVVADVLSHAGCALPSASATVQEFCADVASYGARADIVGLARGKSVLSGTLSSVKFDWFVSAAIFTSWCGFCCGDARCGRCPRKPRGFQDGLLPLLAAMLLGSWPFVFYLDELWNKVATPSMD